MVFPDPSKHNLVIDPQLTEDELRQVGRWERWPKEGLVLTFLCLVVLMLPVGSIFMGEPSLDVLDVAAWSMIAAFVITWFIAMDHRVFRPLFVTRRLIRQRRVLLLQDGMVWQAFLREHRRIGTVHEDYWESLYNKLYLAVRDAVRIEQGMLLREDCEDDFDESVRAGDLAQRDAVLQAIAKEIDLYDPTV